MDEDRGGACALPLSSLHGKILAWHLAGAQPGASCQGGVGGGCWAGGASGLGLSLCQGFAQRGRQVNDVGLHPLHFALHLGQFKAGLNPGVEIGTAVP